MWIEWIINLRAASRLLLSDGALRDQKFEDYAMFWCFVVYIHSGDRSFADAKLRYAMYKRLVHLRYVAVKSSILKAFFSITSFYYPLRLKVNKIFSQDVFFMICLHNNAED